MQKALDAGKIDGQVIGAEFLRGYTTILKFSPTRYYYCFRKNDTALKTKFDTAMSQIIIQDPNYISQLRHKYLSQSNETYEGLTKYEKTYIKNHGAINVAVLHNDQPYYYTDLHGKSKGIIPDYYARIASATGLHFKFTAYDAHTDAVNAVLKGQADIIGMLTSPDTIRSFAEEGYTYGGNANVRRTSVKIYNDGSLGARTASLRKPYNDDPTTRGVLYHTTDELCRLITAAHDSGYPVAIHAIGDNAVETALDAIEKERKLNGSRGFRDGIIHVQITDRAMVCVSPLTVAFSVLKMLVEPVL